MLWITLSPSQCCTLLWPSFQMTMLMSRVNNKLRLYISGIESVVSLFYRCTSSFGRATTETLLCHAGYIILINNMINLFITTSVRRETYVTWQPRPAVICSSVNKYLITFPMCTNINVLTCQCSGVLLKDANTETKDKLWLISKGSTK